MLGDDEAAVDIGVPDVAMELDEFDDSVGVGCREDDDSAAGEGAPLLQAAAPGGEEEHCLRVIRAAPTAPAMTPATKIMSPMNRAARFRE